jgi:hypothetical protein
MQQLVHCDAGIDHRYSRVPHGIIVQGALNEYVAICRTCSSYENNITAAGSSESSLTGYVEFRPIRQHPRVASSLARTYRAATALHVDGVDAHLGATSHAYPNVLSRSW